MVDLSDDVAFQPTNDVTCGLAFGPSPGGTGDGFQLDVDHVTKVVKAVCDVVYDELVFDGAAMHIEQIRGEDEYSDLESLCLHCWAGPPAAGSSSGRSGFWWTATVRPANELGCMAPELKVEDLCEQDLDAQVERVLTFIQPVFDGSAEEHQQWSADVRSWS